METIPFAGSLRRQWRSRRGYNRVSPTHKRNLKVARFGAVGTAKRSWRLRLRLGPKLRLIRLAASPLRLWYKLKNAYMNMMLRLADNSGTAVNVFGMKRIPKARQTPMAYSRSEFENRLVFEIYKSMVASYELGYNSKLV